MEDNTTGDIEKICKKCHKKVSKYGFYYKNLCRDCYEKSLGMGKQNNIHRNEDISSFIIGLIFIGIIIFIIMSIGSSAKQDAERRKQRELREFDTQLHQDPSTWDKEQQDRYDSFTKWDYKNK